MFHVAVCVLYVIDTGAQERGCGVEGAHNGGVSKRRDLCVRGDVADYGEGRETTECSVRVVAVLMCLCLWCTGGCGVAIGPAAANPVRVCVQGGEGLA